MGQRIQPAHRRANRGLAGRTALEHVARVRVVAELQNPGQIGVSRTRACDRRQLREVTTPNGIAKSSGTLAGSWGISRMATLASIAMHTDITNMGIK